MPPPFLFRSNLNGVLKPSTLNCETGKESSNFVSVTIKISKSCISIGFIMSNLFLIELMFKWPIIICWGWFERRRFKTDLTKPGWIAKLSFIKDS